MSFNWIDYLTLSENLIKEPDSPGPKEAALRAAISRAYYAAFCSARNFAETKEKPPLTPAGNVSDHGSVREHFERSSDPSRRKIGVALDRLRVNRNQADYDDVLVKPESVAEATFKSASSVIKRLKALGL